MRHRMRLFWTALAAALLATVAVVAAHPAAAASLTQVTNFGNNPSNVQGASAADGGNIVQYDDWGGTNQQWQLVRVG